MKRDPVSERISIFDPLSERVNLGLAFVFGALAVFFTFHACTLSHRVVGGMEILVDYMLFNTTHLGLSFIALFSFPEFRRWGRSRASEGRPAWYWVIGIGLAALLLFGIIGPGSRLRTSWIACVAIAPLLLRNVHFAAQSRGLASLYNQKARMALSLGEAELQRFSFHEKIERRLFQVFVLLTGIGWGFFPAYGSLPTWVSRPFALLAVAVALALLVNSCLFPGARRSNKSFFLVRLFVHPLFFIGSMPAIWALQGIHGFEFLSVYRQMKKSSSWSPAAWYVVALTVGVLVCVAIVHIPFQFSFWLPDNGSRAFAVLAALQFTCEFGHYYVETFMFRFSRPEVRESIGPLLLAG